MPAPAAKVEIPRWIQLVGLPLVLILVWAVAGAVRHVVFLFLVALLIALLLSPLVRGVSRTRIPRGFAVALVYLFFALALIVAIGAIGTVVVSETKTAAKRVDSYFTDINGRHRSAADADVDRLQHWLNTHKLGSIHVQQRALDRRFSPHAGSEPLLLRMEHALASYVRGQVLVSLIIGASAGFGLWLLGLLGWLPGGQKYALLFGAFVAVTELIPYVGPWLGSIPPFIYALVVHPLAAVWVAILFLVIHQIEGHVVVPNVMGSALRLHPLLVIFGLLAGGEIYGLPGVFVALPLLAAGRAIWEFFGERVTLEPWEPGEPVPVEVELEDTERQAAVVRR